MRTRGFAGAALLAAVLAVVGCGGDKMGEVSGKVTVDGQTPPDGSSISFVPSDGRSQPAGATLTDGKYTTRVPVGTAKVQIRVPKFANEKAHAGPGGGGQRVVGELLPSKYNDKTELTFEVKPGSNEKNWEITTK